MKPSPKRIRVVFMARWVAVCVPASRRLSGRSIARKRVRVAEFLRTSGRSLLSSASGERDRLSVAMDFEGAARAHQRVQKIEEVLGWRDEMARDVEELHAIAIVPSAHAETIELGLAARWLLAWISNARFRNGG